MQGEAQRRQWIAEESMSAALMSNVHLLRWWRVLQNRISASEENRYQPIFEQYTIPRIGVTRFLIKLTVHDQAKASHKDLMENGRIDRKSGHGNPGLSSTTRLSPDAAQCLRTGKGPKSV